MIKWDPRYGLADELTPPYRRSRVVWIISGVCSNAGVIVRNAKSCMWISRFGITLFADNDALLDKARVLSWSLIAMRACNRIVQH